MSTHIPSAESVREALAPLTMKQIARLAELSGVGAPTIYKIKLGDTVNPGIDTVGKFMPHVASVLEEGRSAQPATD